MDAKAYFYKTIGTEGAGEFKDRGSKFLGFSFPVKDREQINVILKRLKDEHPKANHHCYAWRLGTDGNDFRANDNGEPSGSAGRPILGQIDSAGLTNVLIVVVRYFGGTLLGVPGLINAYKIAAAEGLKGLPIVEKKITKSVRISFDYTLMNDVMMLTKKYEVEISKQKMELFCEFELDVPLQIQDEFMAQLKNVYGLEILS